MAGRFDISAFFKAKNFTSPVFGQIQSSFRKLGKNASASIKELNAGVDATVEKLKAVGAAALVAGGVIGAGLFAAGKQGAEFEQAIASVGAVSLMTKKEIETLSDAAKLLATQTKFSATEIAHGMEEMGRAGLDNNQVLAALPGILSAAAAEGAEFSAVSSNILNILKGMGLGFEESTNVADVLTVASAKTNSSITSLGESMKNVAPVARQFKVSFKDAVAAVALLQDVGMDASEAGTATATMLTKLAKPSKEAAAEMAALGIKFQDAKGNMLPLTEVFGQFIKAGDKAGGNMKQAAFFAELVGLRGQKAAINLKDLFQAGRFGQLRKDLDESAGAAKKMADLRMQSLIGQFSILRNTLDVLAIDLFNLGSDGLTGVVQKTRDWVAANKDLIVSGVKEFIDDVKTSLPQIIVWAARAAKFAGVWLAFAAAIKVASAAMFIFNAIAAANPITLIALAIVAAIALLYAFWPEVSAFFQKLWKGITDLAARISESVGNFFSGVWEKAKPVLIGIAEYLMGWAAILFLPAILAFKALAAVAKFVAGIVVAVWQAALPYLTAIWEAVKSAAGTAWDWIVAKATEIATVIVEVLTPIGEFFSKLWDGFKDLAMKAIDQVISKVRWFVDAVRKLGRNVFGDLFHTDEAGAPPPPGGAGDGSGAPAHTPAVSTAPPMSVAPPLGTNIGYSPGEFQMGNGSVQIDVNGPGKARVTSQPKSGFRLRLPSNGAPLRPALMNG